MHNTLIFPVLGNNNSFANVDYDMQSIDKHAYSQIYVFDALPFAELATLFIIRELEKKPTAIISHQFNQNLTVFL